MQDIQIYIRFLRTPVRARANHFMVLYFAQKEIKTNEITKRLSFFTFSSSELAVFVSIERFDEDMKSSLLLNQNIN